MATGWRHPVARPQNGPSGRRDRSVENRAVLPVYRMAWPAHRNGLREGDEVTVGSVPHVRGGDRDALAYEVSFDGPSGA